MIGQTTDRERVFNLDNNLLEFVKNLEPDLSDILLSTIEDLKGRIGIALYENSNTAYESMSDSKRYLPLLELFRTIDSNDSEEEKECKEILNSSVVRVVDACAGEQKAIKSFIASLNDLIKSKSVRAETILLDIFDKNLDPSLLISKYELPSKSFRLEQASLKDARDDVVRAWNHYRVRLFAGLS